MKLQGEAYAFAVKAKVEAIANNATALALIAQAERWDGKLPATMVPGSAVPMLTIR